jgi:hypothetical protein
MAAKSGILDLIFKGAAKNVGKAAGKGAGSAAKNAPSNVKVVPRTTMATGGSIARAKKYYAETGRPKVVNGRPIPPSLMPPAKKAVPAKKVAPVKKDVPSQSPLRGTTLSSRDVVGRIPKSVIAKARKAEAANKAAYSKSLAKPLEMKKPAPAKKAVAATAAKKADYEKRLRPFNPMSPGVAKKPLPTKPSTPVKKFR